ncbi:hypothetical protein FA13DRAFT_1727021 [Coprinellus micaceus]|uniref:Uncharacterized protein n=1 Tax=Coprinellus micaceus TaxID=71717 RepID=A0A4Y7TR46_COPMI|nr:hypothetical protein FA13DRAFT_1727021 [Coprinellus micaceus]
MKNITVDDTAATSNIALIPSACNGTGWQFEPERGFEGSGYRWCASAEGPKASFTFRGVAIYYSCPSFTGDSMRFVLDGGNPENVNLSSSLSPDLRPDSSIVWWKTGLDFKNHTLEISPGENSTRVYLDAFVYTTLEAQEIASLVGANSKPSASAVAAQNAEPERIANRAPIAVFSIVGFIVFTIFLLISFNLYRMSKARRAQYSWKVPVPPLHQSVDLGASMGGVVKQADSVQYPGGHESSLGHTASAHQSPQPSYGTRPLPAAPGYARRDSEDEPSESPFVAATDLKTRRMESLREEGTYPPRQNSARTDASYSSNSRFEPNRRPRG